MVELSARPWLLAGFLHFGLAAAAGLVVAAPSHVVHEWAPVLLSLAGVYLVAGGLAIGFLSPFVKREPPTALLAHAGLALVLAADAWMLASRGLGFELRLAIAPYALAYAALPLHVGATALAGRPWRGGVALFAKDQPFRVGDTLAAGAALVSMLALVASAALFAWPPRGLPNAAAAVFLLAFALPFFGAFLAFILPRNAKAPLPGVTLLAAALALLASGAAGLALAFAFPLGANFRFPAVAVALGHLFSLWAFARVRVERPGPQATRARPLLRGTMALAVLAPLALALATWQPAQLVLLPLPLHVYAVLAVVLAAACTLYGAPILLNAVPREGRWAMASAALGIAGLFVLGQAIQFDRSAFPGAVVLGIASAALLWGLAPMRAPRRECD